MNEDRDSSQAPERPLWYWDELATAVGAPVGAAGIGLRAERGASGVSGVSIDTRSLAEGDLFIALAGDPGSRFHTSSPGARDGHEFLPMAAVEGAAGALVSSTVPLALPQLRIADTLDGLWALGTAAVRRHRGVRIAITGSSGKTTAKAFLSSALSAPAQAGSLNNFWGVPLSLARTPLDAAFGVYEIGTNRAGEIAPLSELVRPDVAMVLNVHPAHIGNLSSLESLQQEKLSISNSLESISNLVCEYSVAAAAGIAGRVVTFGEQTGARVRLIEQHADHARVDTPGGVLSVRVPGGGRHRALTLAAVMAALICLDEDPEQAADLPASLVPAGRGNERLVVRPEGGEWVLIDDSYNANPASMAAALDSLAETSQPASGYAGDKNYAGEKDHAGEKGHAGANGSYALIGEMLELGEQSKDYHLGLLERCQTLAGVYCVGKGMRVLYDALPPGKRLGYADSAKEINIGKLLEHLPKSGRLLVKGSNRVFWSSQFCSTLAAALETESKT